MDTPPPPPPPPAHITPAEKDLGVVRTGLSMDGKPIAYYKDGTFSYRASIEECSKSGCANGRCRPVYGNDVKVELLKGVGK